MDRTISALAKSAGLIAWTAYILGLLLRSLHVLQLEQYYTWPFVRWVAARRERWAPVERVGLALAAAGLGHAAARRPSPVWWIVWSLVGAWGWWRARSGPAKKPLVLTARAWRLLAGQAVVSSLVTASLAALIARRSGTRWGGGALFVGAGTASLLTPALTAAANVLLWPVEAGLRRFYVWDARRRRRACHPNVIAVSGSYGKTSTKQFTATILSARWPTLTTTGSTNTLMGNARVVREQLRPGHEQLVVELGDWIPGDVRELCEMLEPRVGVFTTIGPEHLERFKTMQRIVEAKAALVDALPPGGLAVVNADDPLVRSLGERARRRGVRVVTYGSCPEADVRATDVRTTRDGLAFTVNAEGCTASFKVGVLGRHNVSNVLAAAATALALGMSLQDVARAAANIEPVEHRLQPIRGAGGVLAIDDAFNSNPRGAAEALHVLGELEGGRRVLVTPGMVELAEREQDENRAFARMAAGVCDEVVLVGHDRAAPLLAGLREGGFPPERTHVVRSLAEATDRLKGILRSGDIVLFENDLPDQYDEVGSRQPAVGSNPDRPHDDGALVTTTITSGERVAATPTAYCLLPTAYSSLRIAYRELGAAEGLPVLVLHGWGATSEAVRVIQQCLADRHRTIAPDLPGFGRSDLPGNWGTAEYAEAIRGFLRQLGIERAHVVGHSRGGAIGIVLAARYPELVERLVVVNSAGICQPLGLETRLRVLAYRTARKAAEPVAALGGARARVAAREWLASRFGSADYRAAGPLRQVMVRLVNEDLRYLLPRIQAPTLVIWGDRDAQTPLASAELMEQLIPDAGLVVFPGAGHFAYADDPGRFCRVVGHFLGA